MPAGLQDLVDALREAGKPLVLTVHDLRNPQAAASPGSDLQHPFDLFAQGAAHGGLWRLPYEARSVLPLALGIGLAKRG